MKVKDAIVDIYRCPGGLGQSVQKPYGVNDWQVYIVWATEEAPVYITQKSHANNILSKLMVKKIQPKYPIKI